MLCEYNYCAVRARDFTVAGVFRQKMYYNDRHFIEAIPSGSDLIDAIVSICRENSIETAVFSVIGSVVSATIGVYDQKQEVYVTQIEKAATEVVSCLGNVTQQGGSPRVRSKIILADIQGNIAGGHLFSPTIVANGEISIQELIGDPHGRS